MSLESPRLSLWPLVWISVACMILAPLVVALALARSGPGDGATPVYGYHVVRAFPHDPNAFTEGLFYENGVLWESTGVKGKSSVRKENLETGQVIEKHDLPAADFGEGIVRWRSNLYQLTWRQHFGYVYDVDTLKVKSTFKYAGEGWALTKDALRLYMSDGTADLRVLDPATLTEERRIHVTDQGRPVDQLNEPEWVKGEIYANVWWTMLIARIDPATGHVIGWLDLTGILPAKDAAHDHPDVLNGIAYDATGDRLFVTGKDWPAPFEIVLTPRKP